MLVPWTVTNQRALKLRCRKSITKREGSGDKKEKQKLKKDAEKAAEVDQRKKSRNHLLSALGATDKRTSNSNSNAVDTSNKDENTIAPQLNEPSNNDEQQARTIGSHIKLQQ